MNTELMVINPSLLSETDRTELEAGIEALISAHKNNRQEINKLVFESVSAMTAGDDYERQLSSKRGLRRFIGGITGSNKKLQDKINSNRAMAQYAAQQTLQRLAEQNLMSFDLIAAVNNKLNASVVAIESEVNEIYSTLLTFFKESRRDMIQLGSRVERLERNVNLLNWQNAIEYQMFQGVEYSSLDTTEKIVCLVRDFYDITKGDWTTSDLLLLKTAMSTIDLSPRDSVNYYEFIQSITYQKPLTQYLLEGKQIEKLPEPYLVPLLGMKKLELLDGEERFVMDTITESLVENGIQTNRDDLRNTLAKRYLMQESQINVDVQVNVYDLMMEMLFNLREAHNSNILTPSESEKESTLFSPISAEEMYGLGCLYKEGKNVTQNYKQAVEWYCKAAEQGHPQAQCDLGLCYEFGEGVDEDLQRAAELYLMAAKQRYDVAQCNLGYMYESGRGVEQSWEQAVMWYSKAAEQGHPRAQCNLGCCYEFGKGVDEDLQRAAELYLMAAKQGYDVAQCNLGYMYESGRGVEQSWERAVMWYSKAAEQNYPRGQYNLAWSYEYGEGVEADMEMALKLYHAAANQNYEEAIKALERLESNR